MLVPHRRGVGCANVVRTNVATIAWADFGTRVVALGAASEISKSEVSRICGELDESLQAFRDRPLDHVEFPYVFLDATYVKARVGWPEREPGGDSGHRSDSQRRP